MNGATGERDHAQFDFESGVMSRRSLWKRQKHEPLAIRRAVREPILLVVFGDSLRFLIAGSCSIAKCPNFPSDRN